jgi:hypothetical protein
VCDCDVVTVAVAVAAAVSHTDLSQAMPHFAVPWLLTWFAHSLPPDTTARLFDALLVSPPTFSLYIAAAVVLARRRELLEIECSMTATHAFFQDMPADFPIEPVLRSARQLLHAVPPTRLFSGRPRPPPTVLPLLRHPPMWARQRMMPGWARERGRRRGAVSTSSYSSSSLAVVRRPGVGDLARVRGAGGERRRRQRRRRRRASSGGEAYNEQPVAQGHVNIDPLRVQAEAAAVGPLQRVLNVGVVGVVVSIMTAFSWALVSVA